MKITIETSSYNQRRYGKPWIARLDFSTASGVFVFGAWLGQAGEEGELSLEVAPGDVVAQGQKDNRNPKNSAPKFSYIDAEGCRVSCGSKVAAVRAARSVLASSPNSEILPPTKQEEI